MTKHQTRQQMSIPWRVPVAIEDVSETGAHFQLVADAETRAAVARVAGLRGLPRLQANFDVRRYGAGGLRVVGDVSGTIEQVCVVTLEPLVNEVAEQVDLLFVPQPAAPPDANDKEAEPLIGGLIDLGALATEFLILGLDPYPRKPGAVFHPPAQDAADAGPFAALAALKKGHDGH
jgi:hypothetical protein